MSKKSCEAAESVEARFMTIECSRSVHSIVLRMARVNSNYFRKSSRISVNYGLSIPFFPVILFGT